MYSVAVFILFQLNNCVRSEKLFLVKQNPTSASLNYLQVLKCILMNSGDENMMKYPVASYLLHDSTGHFYIRNLYNNPKRTLSPLMKNSLQRLLRLPPKNCLTPPTTVGEFTSRNIEIATTANHDHETFDYNTKVQFPAKQNDSIIESNVISKNGKILDHDETSSEAAWVNTTEFKVKEITNNLYSFFDQYKQSLVQFNRIFYKVRSQTT